MVQRVLRLYTNKILYRTVLIAARADPDQRASVVDLQNWKFDFGSSEIEHSFGRRICKYIFKVLRCLHIFSTRS